MNKLMLWMLFLLVPAIGLAGNDSLLYLGVTGGLSMPRTMREEWSNIGRTQSADLYEEMDTGYLAGCKLGYAPALLGNILAVEIEYNYQRNDLDRISSPGFEAGPYTIPAFSSEADDSRIKFSSVFLNIIVRYPEGKAHPYIGVGPGVTRTSISFNEPELTEGYGFVESAADTGFSCQFLAGADLDIASHISIGLVYKYFAAKPTMTWENGTKSDYDPGSHNFALDLKYRF